MDMFWQRNNKVLQTNNLSARKNTILYSIETIKKILKKISYFDFVPFTACEEFRKIPVQFVP
ncbi:hypothetical protein Phum_PHUM265460 [Pediculus humanus corporis]|uniref:Uncharacterized protein n=1 Tax=Pediculus humanus subsp. corporis TaxID=121224 RepID=E0VKI8_PEDHC|nr:uncharacterized protein Phum_PHUM265460 [Pediculus humanus corporis]EEB13894.1 hypothetical protein Phum_PHUM265460 [Pediculus humanus corporis]